VLVHPLGAGRSPTDELERKTAHDTVYFTPPCPKENQLSEQVLTITNNHLPPE
jgi:hypothetical protein